MCACCIFSKFEYEFQTKEKKIWSLDWEIYFLERCCSHSRGRQWEFWSNLKKEKRENFDQIKKREFWKLLKGKSNAKDLTSKRDIFSLFHMWFSNQNQTLAGEKSPNFQFSHFLIQCQQTLFHFEVGSRPQKYFSSK